VRPTQHLGVNLIPCGSKVARKFVPVGAAVNWAKSSLFRYKQGERLHFLSLTADRGQIPSATGNNFVIDGVPEGKQRNAGVQFVTAT
jgi:hypothetical protein